MPLSNMARRTWKVAQIKEHIFGTDGRIRSVVVQLPNKHSLTRSINHLYPLEIEITSSTTATTSFNYKDSGNICDDTDKRPMRRAAAMACDRIKNQLCDQEAVTAIALPGSVMKK